MYTKSQIMQKGHYKTGEIAKMLGISIPTAIKYCDIGIIKASKNQHGHRRISGEDFYNYLNSIGQVVDDTEQNKHDVIYARVSTHKQAERGDLDRQIETVKLFAIDYNVKNLLIKNRYNKWCVLQNCNTVIRILLHLFLYGKIKIRIQKKLPY